jgi:hypothetical protein
MKKYLFLAITLLSVTRGFTQDNASKIDTTISLNLLRAPLSPASSLLGISPNEIQRPTEVKSFMLSLQNAMQNITTLPSSFAIDVAPYWFGKDKISQQLSERQSIFKTLVLSIAAKNLQTKAKIDSTTQIGIGFKISLLTGTFDRADVIKLNGFFEDYANEFTKTEKSDKTYMAITSKIDSIGKRLVRIRDNAPMDELQKLAIQIDSLSNLKTQRIEQLSVSFLKERKGNVKDFLATKPIRTGVKLDVAGGLVWDFPETKFDNAKVLKSSVWLTGGYEHKNGFAVLGIVRYQFNPDKRFADEKGILKTKSVSTLDGGVRLNFQTEDSPFVISSEYIYRSIIGENLRSWRWVMNASYEVSSNTILTLSLGRDFDKTFKSDGNLIAALNLVKGFGKSK